MDRIYIFNFAYNIALRDAVIQKAYKGEKTWIADVIEARKAVEEYINNLLLETLDSEQHAKVFKETAKKVCNSINNSKEKPSTDKNKFTFGNSQKLINMTSKYMYIACYYNKDLRIHFKYCHCPMDSLMLDDVWKKGKEIIKGEGLNNTTFKKSWSLEDWENGEIPKRYRIFQKVIKQLAGNEKNSLEYDFENWGANK